MPRPPRGRRRRARRGPPPRRRDEARRRERMYDASLESEVDGQEEGPRRRVRRDFLPARDVRVAEVADFGIRSVIVRVAHEQIPARQLKPRVRQSAEADLIHPPLRQVVAEGDLTQLEVRPRLDIRSEAGSEPRQALGRGRRIASQARPEVEVLRRQVGCRAALPPVEQPVHVDTREVELFAEAHREVRLGVSDPEGHAALFVMPVFTTQETGFPFSMKNVPKGPPNWFPAGKPGTGSWSTTL